MTLHVILETAHPDHGPVTTVVPRGRTYTSLESALKALGGYQDESGKVRHWVGRVEIVSTGARE